MNESLVLEALLEIRSIVNALLTLTLILGLFDKTQIGIRGSIQLMFAAADGSRRSGGSAVGKPVGQRIDLKPSRMIIVTGHTVKVMPFH